MVAFLRSGAAGAEVANWQTFLNHEVRLEVGLVVDEHFGPKTEAATRQYQTQCKLPVTGVVDNTTRRVAVMEGFVAFIQAKNYTAISASAPARQIRVIVIHTMEYPKRASAAEDVAAWFAGASAPVASAHYCIDQDSTVQCVRERDVAWHAPGVNHDGIGIELDGYAKQTPEEWDDPPSRCILLRAALLIRDLCDRHEIPIRKLSVDELIRGDKGITGHVDVTKAYPGPRRTHWDPGPSFPWSVLIKGAIATAIALGVYALPIGGV